MPKAATVAAAVFIVLVVVLVVARIVSQRRTANRVRKVEEGRQAGVLPPDVADALDKASRRSAQRRER